MKSNKDITKEKPRNIKIICKENCVYDIIGWHRPDLDKEHPNWHYYETEKNEYKEASMIHVRKENIIMIIEEMLKEDYI